MIFLLQPKGLCRNTWNKHGPKAVGKSFLKKFLWHDWTSLVPVFSETKLTHVHLANQTSNGAAEGPRTDGVRPKSGHLRTSRPETWLKGWDFLKNSRITVWKRQEAEFLHVPSHDPTFFGQKTWKRTAQVSNYLFAGRKHLKKETINSPPFFDAPSWGLARPSHALAGWCRASTSRSPGAKTPVSTPCSALLTVEGGTENTNDYWLNLPEPMAIILWL